MNDQTMRRVVGRTIQQSLLALIVTVTLVAAMSPVPGIAQRESHTRVVVVPRLSHPPAVGLIECFPGECTSTSTAILVTAGPNWMQFVANDSGLIGFTEH